MILDGAQKKERFVDYYFEQREFGAWRSPERHKVLTCSGGAGYWTYRRGGEKALGSPSSGKAPCQDDFPAEILKYMQQRRCL